MTKKLLIIVFFLIGVSVAVAAAREVLLTIEMSGTVTTTTELTLYTIGATDNIFASLGDSITAISIPTLAEGTTVSIGSYYLVNTGTTDVNVTYDTQETQQGLNFYVIIGAAQVWVNADGSVEEISEHAWSWYNDKTPYEDIFYSDGSPKPMTFPTARLFAWDNQAGGSNAVQIEILISAQNIDVAQDTPFTLQLSFYSEETS